MNLWPIFVPSKGRPNSKLLKENYPKINIVVEPQDAGKYIENFPQHNILVLPENNRGIAYVRNFILERNEDWFWMLDDDISAFYINEQGKKSEKVGGEQALLRCQEIIYNLEQSIAQGAIEYQQFAYSGAKELTFNSYCDAAVCINPQLAGKLCARYDDKVNLKEDRDFTIQLLAAGFKTVRIQRVGFTAPSNGSNKGGLYDEYQQSDRERQAATKLAAKWPGLVQVVTKKSGRVDAKINWRMFKHNSIGN